MRVVPDKEDSDRVHISITLSQASSQQAGSKKPDWPAGQAFLKKNNRAKLVTSLFLLRDLLDPIEVLITGFQKDDFYAHNIEVLVSNCIDK